MERRKHVRNLLASDHKRSQFEKLCRGADCCSPALVDIMYCFRMVMIPSAQIIAAFSGVAVSALRFEGRARLPNPPHSILPCFGLATPPGCPGPGLSGILPRCILFSHR